MVWPVRFLRYGKGTRATIPNDKTPISPTPRWRKGCLPRAMITSAQIDQDALARHRDERRTVITGTVGGNSPLSCDFMKDAIGYGLAAFFERSSSTLRRELRRVLEAPSW